MASEMTPEERDEEFAVILRRAATEVNAVWAKFNPDKAPDEPELTNDALLMWTEAEGTGEVFHIHTGLSYYMAIGWLEMTRETLLDEWRERQREDF